MAAGQATKEKWLSGGLVKRSRCVAGEAGVGKCRMCVVYSGDGGGIFSGADGSKLQVLTVEKGVRIPLDRLLKRKRRHVISNGGLEKAGKRMVKTN